MEHICHATVSSNIRLTLLASSYNKLLQSHSNEIISRKKKICLGTSIISVSNFCLTIFINSINIRFCSMLHDTCEDEAVNAYQKYDI